MPKSSGGSGRQKIRSRSRPPSRLAAEAKPAFLHDPDFLHDDRLGPWDNKRAQDLELHSLSPAQMRMRAAELRQVAKAKLKEARALLTAADEIDAARKEANMPVTTPSLQPPDEGSTVTTVTSAQLGLESSKARAGASALVQAANRHGFSLRTLAVAVQKRTKIKTTHSHLSLAYQAKRPLHDKVKAAVKSLTGFDVWPEFTGRVRGSSGPRPAND